VLQEIQVDVRQIRQARKHSLQILAQLEVLLQTFYKHLTKKEGVVTNGSCWHTVIKATARDGLIHM
jgi:hypothetical protein